MTPDPSRRFTDREVSLVLRRASEIDEREGASLDGSGGLSLDDLRGIAGEVGISAHAIERAVASLESGGPIGPAWAGGPLVRKAARAVPGELDRGAIARLVQVVDERADHTGAISEALGSVRWTASDRLRSSLVTITPADGETRIQVVEKALPRVRRVFHFLPPVWGAMIATPILASAGLGAAASVGVLALGAAAGAGVGRAAWAYVSSRSARRVEAMAAALAREAAASAGAPARPGLAGETE
jgi:hypothetical protein